MAATDKSSSRPVPNEPSQGEDSPAVYNVLGYYEHPEGYIYIKFFFKFNGERKYTYKPFQIVEQLDSSWKPYILLRHNKLHSQLEALGRKVVSYKPSVRLKTRITLLNNPPDKTLPYLVELVTGTSKHQYGFVSEQELPAIKQLTPEELCYKLALMKHETNQREVLFSGVSQ